ncbi:hypothetical protein MLD38_028924 [Melastoma candidum]|uniref:Uncharacterized protein n=1 Tax=Melastoma candidum TaxID=119954 RepID=A0ACB9N422_9MYRT|nr:hypothetical protein MLD38_028924 [Melastoma candidum]
MLTLLSIFLALSASPSLCDRPQPHVVHPLRPQTGFSSRPNVYAVSCLSWRLAVETDNIRNWDVVPKECEGYVGNYMLGRQYRMDSATVANAAIEYAKGLKVSRRDAWVFDIDETSLSNLPYYAANGFGTMPYNATSFSAWTLEGRLPVLPETHRLYQELLRFGIKVIFLTGRAQDQTSITVANLKRGGYHTWHKLILKGTPYSGETALLYKSTVRTKLEKSGYRIVGNIGDQWSDLLGPTPGNRTFKVPDPMYYLG